MFFNLEITKDNKISSFGEGKVLSEHSFLVSKSALAL